MRYNEDEMFSVRAKDKKTYVPCIKCGFKLYFRYHQYYDVQIITCPKCNKNNCTQKIQIVEEDKKC